MMGFERRRERERPVTRIVELPDGSLRADNRKPTIAQRIADAAPTIIVGLVIVIAVVVALNQSQDQNQSEEIARQADAAQRENSIGDFKGQLKRRRVCVHSTNQQRINLRNEFRDLKLDVLRPVFASVAAISEPPVSVILDDAVATIDRRVMGLHRRFPRVDCSQRYPLLDDPRTAFDEADENRTP